MEIHCCNGMTNTGGHVGIEAFCHIYIYGKYMKRSCNIVVFVF